MPEQKSELHHKHQNHGDKPGDKSSKKAKLEAMSLQRPL